MKNFKTQLLIFIFPLIFFSCDSGNKIDNNFLSATFNTESNTLEIFSKTRQKTIVKEFVALGIQGSIEKTTTSHPDFGDGNSLVIGTNEGGYFTFTLYKDQPFLFVTEHLVNKKSENINIDKLKPVSFKIDLGKEISKIKTLGTGGLLSPDENPGSYVFLTTADTETRNGIVTGWLTNEKGSGVVFSSTKDSLVQIDAQIDYGRFLLTPNQEEDSETLLIGYFDDARIGEEKFADALAVYNHTILRDREAVYCTWYTDVYGGAGTEASSIELASFISKELKPFGMGVLQIDDLWQAGGKYNGPTRGFDRVDKNGPYPNGMEKTTKAIKEAGLTAGLWWMPFSRNHEDPQYADKQDWFVKRTNGTPFETVWGGTSLDLTKPEVQAQISSISKKMIKWGFDYFKMDGLFTGTATEQIYINDGYKYDSIGNIQPLYNPKITQIQAFRDGLKLIRKATDNNVFLSGCTVSQNMRSFGGSIGLVDAMRIGPDFNHDGQSIRTGVLRASRLYFLNGRVWWNDPDPSMVREKGESSVDPAAAGIGPSIDRARILPSFVAVTGQFFLSSDWLPILPEERLDIMKRTMVSHTGIARPVDAFTNNLPTIWRTFDDKSGTERNIIGFFNWKEKEATIETNLVWAGLKENTTYYGYDFWENKMINNINGSMSLLLKPESSRVISLREKQNHPVLVSTSQHITQGMIDVKKEDWEKGVLSGTSTLIAGDPYEIRIAGLKDGGNWKLIKAVIDGENTSIEVLPQEEDNWLKVVVSSKESLEVNWRLEFEDLK